MKEYTLNLASDEHILVQKQADKHHPTGFLWTGMILIVLGLILILVIDPLLIYLAYGVLILAVLSFLAFAVIKNPTALTIYMTDKRIAILGPKSYFGIMLDHIQAIEAKGHKVILYAGEGVVYLTPVDDAEGLKNSLELHLAEQRRQNLSSTVDVGALKTYCQELINAQKVSLMAEMAAKQQETLKIDQEAIYNNCVTTLNTRIDKLTNDLNQSMDDKIKAFQETLEVKTKPAVTLTPKANAEKEINDDVIADEDVDDVKVEALQTTLDFSKAKKGTGKVKDAKTIVEEKAAALKSLENK